MKHYVATVFILDSSVMPRVADRKCALTDTRHYLGGGRGTENLPNTSLRARPKCGTRDRNNSPVKTS
jgi:hypothetical protein